MQQMNLMGNGVKKQEQIDHDEHQRQWQIGEHGRFCRIKSEMEQGIFNEMWVGEWWYCNKIVGWPEIEHFKSPIEMEYTMGVDNELMSSLRSVHETRIGHFHIVWNKEYALQRITKAIDSYAKMIWGEGDNDER